MLAYSQRLMLLISHSEESKQQRHKNIFPGVISITCEPHALGGEKANTLFRKRKEKEKIEKEEEETVKRGGGEGRDTEQAHLYICCKLSSLVINKNIYDYFCKGSSHANVYTGGCTFH